MYMYEFEFSNSLIFYLITFIFAISLIDDLVHSFDKKMAKIWMSLLFQIPTLKEDKNTPTSLPLTPKRFFSISLVPINCSANVKILKHLGNCLACFVYKIVQHIKLNATCRFLF